MTPANRTRGGFTLIELMITIAVALVLSAAALQFFATQTGYARMAALQTDMADRSRVVREIISNDLLRTGFHWSHEGSYGSPEVKTGTFGSAGLGSALVNWSQRPLDGVDNTTAADVLYVIVPSGSTEGGNALPHGAAYKCDESASMGLASVSVPVPAYSGWSVGRVMLVAGSGVTFVTTLVSLANPNFTLGALAGGGCVLAGTVNGTALPERISAVPVQGIAYTVDDSGSTPELRRCVTTDPARGPKVVVSGATATATNYCSTVMLGVEDIQVRYVFVEMAQDASASAVYLVDSPSSVTTDNAVVGGGHSKRRIADAANPYLRLIAVDVAVVVRALKRDNVTFHNKGLRPASFNRTAAASTAVDSFRRIRTQWRVVLPSATNY